MGNRLLKYPVRSAKFKEKVAPRWQAAKLCSTMCTAVSIMKAKALISEVSKKKKILVIYSDGNYELRDTRAYTAFWSGKNITDREIQPR